MRDYTGQNYQDVLRKTSQGLMTTQDRDRYFADPANQQSPTQSVAQPVGPKPSDNIGGGISREQNQSKMKQLGYGGDFGSGGGDQYLTNNPGKYMEYVSWRKGIDPSYTPHVDMNPGQAGTQSFGAPLNKYLGEQVGYYGPVGGGQLGSGASNDYLQSNQGSIDSYERMRRIFDPSYTYSGSRQQAAPQNVYQQRPYIEPTRQAAPAPVAPTRTRPAASVIPKSLSDMQDLTDIQRRAAISTDAIYGAGSDKEQQDYYLNMLQRLGLNDAGQTQNIDLLPVESQYLQSIGLPYNNTADFLDTLARYYGSNQTY